MPGPAPKQTRRRKVTPGRGEWKATPGIGWQYGEVPPVPDGLVVVSREAWRVWMQSWFAAHWTPDDIPGLHVVIGQYDAVARANPAKANDVTTLVRLMDTYGITPAGQQARRWAPPKAEEKPEAPKIAAAGRYGHLRAVAG